MRFAVLCLYSLLLLAGESIAATITVNTIVDDVLAGDGCSLREAIIAANGDTPVNDCSAGNGLDTIVFAVPGVGPHEIELLTELPAIVAPLLVDGRTQSGSGCPHEPMISLTGDVDSIRTVFRFESGSNGSGVMGLRIHGLLDFGFGLPPPAIGLALRIEDISSFKLQCNVIGIDASGNSSMLGTAILGLGVQGLVIGSDRDAIDDELESNIILASNAGQIGNSEDVVVAGNWIGVTNDEPTIDPETGAGGFVFQATNGLHVGVDPQSPNVIHRNIFFSSLSVSISGGADIVVAGNFFGVTPDGRLNPHPAIAQIGVGAPTGLVTVGGLNTSGEVDPRLANTIVDTGGCDARGCTVFLGIPGLVPGEIRFEGNLVFGRSFGSPVGQGYLGFLIDDAPGISIVIRNNAIVNWQTAVQGFVHDGVVTSESTGNCFENNQLVAENLGGRGAINLAGNWWGSDDGPSGLGGGHGGAVGEGVTYQPFLGHRPPSCSLIGLVPRSAVQIPALSPWALVMLVVFICSLGVFQTRAKGRGMS